MALLSAVEMEFVRGPAEKKWHTLPASDKCLCESLCSEVKRALEETQGCQLYPFKFYGENANVTSQQVQLARLLSNRMSLMKE